ncbi:hypothetical protein Tco_0603129 [Tanacetum coccineum]
MEGGGRASFKHDACGGVRDGEGEGDEAVLRGCSGGDGRTARSVLGGPFGIDIVLKNHLKTIQGLMRFSLDFNKKFYNSLGSAPIVSVSIGKTSVVIVLEGNRLGKLDQDLTEIASPNPVALSHL